MNNKKQEKFWTFYSWKFPTFCSEIIKAFKQIAGGVFCFGKTISGIRKGAKQKILAWQQDLTKILWIRPSVENLHVFTNKKRPVSSLISCRGFFKNSHIPHGRWFLLSMGRKKQPMHKAVGTGHSSTNKGVKFHPSYQFIVGHLYGLLPWFITGGLLMGKVIKQGTSWVWWLQKIWQ